MNKLLFLYALFFGLFVFLALPSSALDSTINATNDTTVNACYGTGCAGTENGTNYASRVYLQVGKIYLTTPFASFGVARTLANFSVSSIPSTVDVVDANVSFYCWASATYNTSQQLDIYNVNQTWNFSNVTWDVMPTYDNTVLYNSSTLDCQGWQTFNITGLARGWINGTISDLGLYLKRDSEAYVTGADDNKTYSSVENGSNMPKLEVFYSLCQDISASTTVTLTGNASLENGSVRSICMNFTGASGTLDCNNYAVIDNTGGYGTGISASGQSGITIKNCVTQGFKTHISLTNSPATINNVNLSSGTTGIDMNGLTETYSNLSNITMTSLTTGLYLHLTPASNKFDTFTFNSVNYPINMTNTLGYNNFTTVTINDPITALTITNANNSKFVGVTFSGSTTDLYHSDTISNNFLGSNLTNSKVTAVAPSNYTVAFYTDVTVTDCSNSTNLQGVNVTFYNVNGTYADTSQTGSNGNTGSRNITSYYRTNDSVTNYTAHTVYANASGYTNSSSTVYVTQNQSISTCISQSGSSTVAISLPKSLVDFSSVSVGNDYYSYNASGLTKRFFTVSNDGTVKVNITLTASAPFTANSTPMPDTWYRYNVTENQSGSISACSVQTPNSWYSMNSTGQSGVPFGICQLNYTSNSHSANVTINWKIPTGEPAGSKSSTVIFTASQA